MELNNILSAHPAIVGLFTFLFGMILGHRLTLYRDIRKEKIIAAEPIRQWIRQEKKQLDPVENHDIDADMLDRYCLTLGKGELRKFNTAYNLYLKETKNKANINKTKNIKLPGYAFSGDVFSSEYINKDPLIAKLDALDKLTQHG